MKPTPSKTISFKLEENNYEVKYPNTGQFIDIEATKARITGDSYGTLLESRTTASLMARFSVDMIAFFAICAPPDLKKDLNVASFAELEMIHSKKLLQVYLKTILPWLTAWEELLNEDDSETDVELKP